MWIILIIEIELNYIEKLYNKIRFKNSFKLLNYLQSFTTQVNNRASFFIEQVHNIKISSLKIALRVKKRAI
ncbi:hypothetical protein B9T35_13300 [Acinetobacter sp. ANC 3832]|nr:hypothetical protein B9T35_13300 [Acinetobacter sp. ANC 3832]